MLTFIKIQQRFCWLFLCWATTLSACSSEEQGQQLADQGKYDYQTDSTFIYFDPLMQPFYHGVASGDPTPNAVIIWTRVTTAEGKATKLNWLVAVDSLFEETVAEGEVVALPKNDFTAKVDVRGLQPDTYYYYKFILSENGAESVTGRTKTTPDGDAQQVNLAFVSCSNYEAGYYNAFAHLAQQQNLDGIVHLGDYIYEYAPGVYGDKSLNRKHLPKKEIVSLQDYRTRYAQYRLDPDFQKAHQMHPFITVWDDHEIANNSYTTGAQNHQPEAEGDYSERKANARKAYFEWLPLRDNPENKLYRSIHFGKLADMFMLDGRLEGRTKPAESEDALAKESPTMLGDAQMEWLKSGLAASEATWKLLGNQVIFADLNLSPVWKNTTKNLDAWDGYPAEKQEIITFLDTAEVENTVILTGDTHATWAFEVPRNMQAYIDKANMATVAVELGTPSISSSNSNERNPDDSVKMGEQVLMQPDFNPHLKMNNQRDHGYLLLRLTPEQATAQWYYVETLKERKPSMFLGYELKVPAGKSKIELLQ